MIAAWLNSVDTKANNTLDMYVEEDGRQFVKHYIIDFATSLGAGGWGPASASRGKHGAADVGNMLLRALTLGLWVEPYEKKLGEQISPSVGYFDSELFDPGDFAFIIPNPAFKRATELDGFWGAKLVMSFSDADIRAIVEATPTVDTLNEVRTLHRGPNDVLLALSLDFEDNLTSGKVEDAIDQLENVIKQRFPIVKPLFI